jgi:hypothetical protein
MWRISLASNISFFSEECAVSNLFVCCLRNFLLIKHISPCSLWSYQNGDYGGCYLLMCVIFNKCWRNVLPWLLANLKMATRCSSKTLVIFCHVRWLHISDDSVFHNSSSLSISFHKFTYKIIDLDENIWIWSRVLWNLSYFRWCTKLWICNLLKTWTEHFDSVWYCSNLLCCYYVLGLLIAACINFFIGKW